MDQGARICNTRFSRLTPELSLVGTNQILHPVIAPSRKTGDNYLGHGLGGPVKAAKQRQSFLPARCLNEEVTERKLLPHADVTQVRSLPHDVVT